MSFLEKEERWRDYFVDFLQLFALIVTVSVILYCVDCLLNFYAIK